ncbi:MAG: phytanoyl-CoA dioxygenase family protein [Acidobacteriota bacterium]|nr:phytanoyl-CoA dioxygenase family protein [Acidobacteriota bacterium]
MNDLSTEHRPILSIFEQPNCKGEWDHYRLSPDDLEFYHENGYLAGVPMLDNEQVELLRTELAELLNPNHPGRQLFYEYNSNESADPSKVLFHALGAWRVAPGFHDLLWNPRLIMPASQLLDGGVRFWHDQIFYKPPHHGGVVAWHQDYSYWTRTRPMAHLSCWIGLDDAKVGNGCVHYVPRSHRWNLLPITGLAENMHAIQGVLNEAQKKQFKPVAIELRKGQASFHHPLMVHGSFENRTDKARRATVLNVFRDGTLSAADEPPLQGVPAIRRGDKIDGQFFPLLFDPERDLSACED